jgi:integrase
VTKLTDSIVKKLPAPATGNKLTFDSEVTGFGARVTAGGARAFILNYRTRSGLQRRYTLGSFPDWGTAAARDEAKRLKREIEHGADPVHELKAERGAPTMLDLFERYMSDHAPKKRERTRRDDEGIWNQVLAHPGLKHMKVAEVTYSDMDGLHRKITKAGKPIRANRTIEVVSKAFNLSIKWGWRPNNPCKGIEQNQETPRTRYMTPEELERLTKALAEYRDQAVANAVRLLLLTGARRGEVLGATWDQFDLTEGVWTKPGSTTKQKTVHRVPLSAPAWQLLVKMHDASESEYLFPGYRGAAHLADLKEVWPKICKAAHIKNLRLHDLRHSYASVLASSGQSLLIIGKLLGHSRPETTQRYAHLLDDPLRAATNTAGAVITGKPEAEVVPFKKGA